MNISINDLRPSIFRRGEGGKSQYLTSALLLTAIVTSLPGCTSVHIHNNDSVKLTTQFGLAVISIRPEISPATLVKTKGLGFISTPTGITLGWIDETLALIPAGSNCKAIIWIESKAEIESIVSLLHRNNKSLNNICVLKDEEKNDLN